MEGITANGRCVVRVRAHALPAALATLLDDNHDLLRQAALAGPEPEQQVSGLVTWPLHHVLEALTQEL